MGLVLEEEGAEEDIAQQMLDLTASSLVAVRP